MPVPGAVIVDQRFEQRLMNDSIFSGNKAFLTKPERSLMKNSLALKVMEDGRSGGLFDAGSLKIIGLGA